MAIGWFLLGVTLIAALLLGAALLPRAVTVLPWQVALIYRRGRFERELGPGRHWLVGLGQPSLAHLTAVPQAASVGPLDLFSQEGFGLRATLSLTWRIADARAYWEASAGTATFGGVRLPGFDEAVQAAALTAAGARPLAEMLADPQALGAAVLAAVAGEYPVIALETATVARVTLPPEVRRLRTEAEAARLQGLAALERARGEQAALRSLANAARLVRDNPELAQLRLLQAIETAKRPPTIVLGNGVLGNGASSAGPAAD